MPGGTGYPLGSVERFPRSRSHLFPLSQASPGAQTFDLADGTEVERAVGSAEFEVAGRRGASTVIFGKRGDACLLGVVTLEELGMVLDPLRRRLRPMRLRLG